jgi:hypothetical protein
VTSHQTFGKKNMNSARKTFITIVACLLSVASVCYAEDELATLSATITSGKWVKNLGEGLAGEVYVYSFAKDGSYTAKLHTDYGTPIITGKWALSKGEEGKILLRLHSQIGKKDYYWLREVSQVRHNKENDQLVISGAGYVGQQTMRHEKEAEQAGGGQPATRAVSK